MQTPPAATGKHRREDTDSLDGIGDSPMWKPAKLMKGGLSVLDPAAATNVQVTNMHAALVEKFKIVDHNLEHLLENLNNLGLTVNHIDAKQVEYQTTNNERMGEFTADGMATWRSQMEAVIQQDRGVTENWIKTLGSGIEGQGGLNMMMSDHSPRSLRRSSRSCKITSTMPRRS